MGMAESAALRLSQRDPRMGKSKMGKTAMKFCKKWACPFRWQAGRQVWGQRARG